MVVILRRRIQPINGLRNFAEEFIHLSWIQNPIREIYFGRMTLSSVAVESTKPENLWSACGNFVIDWLIDWNYNWLIDWLIETAVDWLIDWLIESTIDWLIDWLELRLIDWLTETTVDWLIDWNCSWSIDWLIDWLIGTAVDWLIDWLIDWLKLKFHCIIKIEKRNILDENFSFKNIKVYKNEKRTNKFEIEQICESFFTMVKILNGNIGHVLDLDVGVNVVQFRAFRVHAKCVPDVEFSQPDAAHAAQVKQKGPYQVNAQSIGENVA